MIGSTAEPSSGRPGEEESNSNGLQQEASDITQSGGRKAGKPLLPTGIDEVVDDKIEDEGCNGIAHPGDSA